MVNQDKLIGLIAETLGVKEENIKEDSRFVEDLGADSLDVTELLLGIEDQFSIKIPDDEAGKFKTVKDLMVYLGGK